MIFNLYIKSHTAMPDYEDTCEAENIEQASSIFAKRMPEWSPEMLLPYIGESVDYNAIYGINVADEMSGNY